MYIEAIKLQKGKKMNVTRRMKFYSIEHNGKTRYFNNRNQAIAVIEFSGVSSKIEEHDKIVVVDMDDFLNAASEFRDPKEKTENEE